MPVKTLAEVAALAASGGMKAIRAFRQPVDGIVKNASGEFVTDADLASESAILRVIRRHRPDDSILAEESGERSGSTGVRWIVDPLDGTVNFARGIDRFSVSVAAERDGHVVAAAICQPFDGLSLVLDHGTCTSNHGKVAVAAAVEPRRAVISFAVPYGQSDRATAYRHLALIAPQVGDLRNSGSTVCDLAAVAMGRLDGFVGFGQSAWDIAAGLGIVEAAGGFGVIARLPVGMDMVVAGPELVVSAVLEWSGIVPEPRGGRPPGCPTGHPVVSPTPDR